MLPTSCRAAANATANGTIPAGTYEPKACFGGTAANCFSAACRSGAPTSKRACQRQGRPGGRSAPAWIGSRWPAPARRGVQPAAAPAPARLPAPAVLPEGAPAYNATCYCPYFTTKKEP